MPLSSETAQGALVRLSMADEGTAIGSYSEAHEILNENLIGKTPIMDNNGLRGTFAHDISRTRLGNDDVGGDINYTLSPLVLDLLGPRMFGQVKSGNNFDFSDNGPAAFDTLVDRITKRFVYGGCKIGRWTLRGKVGGFVELVCTIMGKTYATYATAFPTITIPVDAPYVFTDGAISIGGVDSRKIFDFEVMVDWAFNKRYTNSTQATGVLPQDRVVSVKMSSPFTSSEYDMYTSNSVDGNIVLTNGNCSVTLTFGKLRFDKQDPNTPGKSEIILPLQGKAWANGSTPDLRITNDSTP